MIFYSGGYLFIAESVPHTLDKTLNLDGIKWVEKVAENGASGVELKEKRTDLIYDLHNKEKAYILVLKRNSDK